MMEHVHVLEPTLEGEAGHCFSFISSLCNVTSGIRISLWCGHNAKLKLPVTIDIHYYFYRKIRKIQFYLLCRSLLKKPGRIFVSTATRTDILLLSLAAVGKIPPKKVFFYVHWFKTSSTKRRQLKRLATHQPELIILAPTASVCEEFLAAGFTHTRHVPYPITPLAFSATSGGIRGFSHVLFAGAARHDKGFGDVVNFVELLYAKGSDIQVSLQTSAQHYDKIDEATSASLARLGRLSYPYLKCYTDTLQHADYRALFSGAICLQLYSQQDFFDRISGVTLDAFNAGSPVVTLSGTWMARVVAEFDAGVVIDSPAAEEVFAAVSYVIGRYEYYVESALKAGRELQKRNSAKYLLHELTV